MAVCCWNTECRQFPCKIGSTTKMCTGWGRGGAGRGMTRNVIPQRLCNVSGMGLSRREGAMLGKQPVPVKGTGNHVEVWNEVAAGRDDRYETLWRRNEGATVAGLFPRSSFTATARKCRCSIFCCRSSRV